MNEKLRTWLIIYKKNTIGLKLVLDVGSKQKDTNWHPIIALTLSEVNGIANGMAAQMFCWKADACFSQVSMNNFNLNEFIKVYICR